MVDPRLVNVVIPCFKRTSELNRLLRSLKNQKDYNNNYKIWFFIDYSDLQADIVSFIEDITTGFSIEIVAREVRFGLKKNIIESVSETFERCSAGYLVLLEDDLILSRFTFNYIENSVEYSLQNRDNIFGLSLYTPSKNSWNDVRFIRDNLHGFFLLQLPSSWGAVLFREKWTEFYSRLSQSYELEKDVAKSSIPVQVGSWNRANSWKLELLLYLIETDKYFLYPDISFTSHLSLNGTNVQSNELNTSFNSTLSEKYDRHHFQNFEFKRLQTFDSFFEPTPDRFESIFGETICDDLVVDTYGLKPLHLKKKYWLTSKKVNKSIKSYAFEIETPIKNIDYELYGDFFKLAKHLDVIEGPIDFSRSFFEANYSSQRRRGILKYIIHQAWIELKRRVVF